jgi:hypothetical protein
MATQQLGNAAPISNVDILPEKLKKSCDFFETANGGKRKRGGIQR